MAATTKYTDILTHLSRTVPRAAEDNYAAQIINIGMEKLWNSFDWRETLRDFPPFHPIPGESEYPDPLVVLPTDFYGFRQMYISRVGEDVSAAVLKPLQNTSLRSYRGYPESIGLLSGPNGGVVGVRLHPIPADSIGPPTYVVHGTYKMRSPTVTNNTITAVCPFDDTNFGTVYDAFAWAAAKFSGSRQAQLEALNVFRMSLSEMATREGLNVGSHQLTPTEALA